MSTLQLGGSVIKLLHFEKNVTNHLQVINLDSNIEEVAQRADIMEGQVTSVLAHRRLRTHVHREWKSPGIVGKVTSKEVEHARPADARLVCWDQIQAGWVSIQNVFIGFLHRRLKNMCLIY
jgi:hypothetical protein